MIKLLKNNNSNAICLLSINTFVTFEVPSQILKILHRIIKIMEFSNCSRFAGTTGYKYYYMIQN